MQGPHVVGRKAPIAAKFEGGAENATPIINWILSNNGVARWSDSDSITIDWDEGKWVRLVPGDWVVYDEGNYWTYSEEAFHILYDDKEPFKDFAERHLGEDAQHTFVARELTVKAMRMPSPKENEAAKDLEERVRAIAQFIDAEGGVVFEFNVDELGISYEGKNIRLEPGEWVVSDFKNELHFLSHQDFRLFYKSVEEASNDAQPA